MSATRYQWSDPSNPKNPSPYRQMLHHVLLLHGAQSFLTNSNWTGQKFPVSVEADDPLFTKASNWILFWARVKPVNEIHH
jgi:hypothetical protein